MPPHKRPKNEEETAAKREVDRISDLPEGVLHHLLSLMPAVRTCVLAQSWRHIWRSAPAIRFGNDKWTGSGDRFNQFVDRVLQPRLHHGGPLDSCDFDLEENELYSNEFLAANEQRLSRWIWRALRLQVRVLRFHLGFDSSVSLPNRALLSERLTTLKLQSICASQSVLDFSGCPTLVDLTMAFCIIDSASISSPSLKHLQMIGGSFEDDRRARMSLPSLVSLELDEIFGRIPLLESMPSLATAVVRVGGGNPADRCEKGGSSDCGDDACEGCRYYYDGFGDDLTRGVFLASLAQATDLELSADPDMFVFKRDLKWCSTFTNLKTLVLSEWFVIDDLGALVWFPQHPVLEKLTLHISKVHEISEGTTGKIRSDSTISCI